MCDPYKKKPWVVYIDGIVKDQTYQKCFTKLYMWFPAERCSLKE